MASKDVILEFEQHFHEELADAFILKNETAYWKFVEEELINKDSFVGEE